MPHEENVFNFSIFWSTLTGESKANNPLVNDNYENGVSLGEKNLSQKYLQNVTNWDNFLQEHRARDICLMVPVECQKMGKNFFISWAVLPLRSMR